MKFNYPKSLILDVKLQNLKYSNDYWLPRHLNSFKNKLYFNQTLNLISLENKDKIFSKNTINYSGSIGFSKTLSEKLNVLVKSNLMKNKSLKKTTVLTKNLTVSMFDINFVKKERLYTKLKYSRSPAYDIVSGGSAALFAAFIGFLISEKFGIELVDSGDFYIAFMYAVFISLSCRPLLRILSKADKMWSVISPNYFIEYILVLYTLFLKNFTKLIIKLPSTNFIIVFSVFFFLIW